MPILANIHLYELYEFVESLRTGFDKKAEQNRTTEYGNLQTKLQRIKKKLETAVGSEKVELMKQMKEIRKKLLKTPSKSQTDKKT